MTAAAGRYGPAVGHRPTRHSQNTTVQYSLARILGTENRPMGALKILVPGASQ